MSIGQMTGDDPLHQGPVLPTSIFEDPFSEPVPGSTPFGGNTLTWRTKNSENKEIQLINLIRKNRFCYVYSGKRLTYKGYVSIEPCQGIPFLLEILTESKITKDALSQTYDRLPNHKSGTPH